jgi:hypothetical protein
MLYVANDLRIHPQPGLSFVSDNGKEGKIWVKYYL